MGNPESLKPFTKGYDPRRNRKGRPKSFDALRALAQQIAREEVQMTDGTYMSRAELILRAWTVDKNPLYQKAFLEIAYGKVPDKIDLSGNVTTPKTYAEWVKIETQRKNGER